MPEPIPPTEVPVTNTEPVPPGPVPPGLEVPAELTPAIDAVAADAFADTRAEMDAAVVEANEIDAPDPSIFAEKRKDFKEVAPFRVRKMLQASFGEAFTATVDAEAAFNCQPLVVFISELGVRDISSLTGLANAIVSKLNAAGFFGGKDGKPTPNSVLLTGLFEVVSDSIEDVISIVSTSCFKDPMRDTRFDAAEIGEWSISMLVDLLHAIWDVNYHYGTSLKKVLGGLFKKD